MREDVDETILARRALADYKEARESLIQSRATHLDQLIDKLREPRI